MARAFCAQCGEEVEVRADGRDDRGHEVSGAEPEPWVADVAEGASDAPAPAASTGGEGADDIDFGSLEAAVAELGLSVDDSDDDAFAAFEEEPARTPVDEAPAAAPAAAGDTATDGQPRPDADDIAAATDEAEPWDTDALPPDTDVPEGTPADEAPPEPTEPSTDQADAGTDAGTEQEPADLDTANFTARPKGKSRGGLFRRG